MKKYFWGLIVVLFMSFTVLTGCGNKEDNATEGNNETSESATRIVSTKKGDVEIPANPQRIADVSGSSEVLLALGIVPVATADSDAYDQTKLPSYLEGKMDEAKIVGYNMNDTMDIEGILEADPDLILISERQEKIYDQLKEIAPVVMLENFDNDWRGRIEFVGELLGKEDVAEKWLADYDSKAATISEAIMEKNGAEKTYLSILTGGDQFFVLANAGIGDILYNDLNLARPVNLPEQTGVELPVVTIEGLSEIDADHIIVVATDADKASLEANSVWKAMRAVKDGNVTFLNSSPVFVQSYQPIGKYMLLDILKEELTN